MAKPDAGVGAQDTCRLNCEADLAKFFSDKPDANYMMEEFISGNLNHAH